MSEIERPQKTSVILARRIIRDAGRAGVKPGQILAPEHQMIERYGVGRSTLREALRLLEFQGAITLKPGPGGGPVLQLPDASFLASSLMLIMQLSDAPFRILLEARATVEPRVSQLAAERISDEEIVELKAAITRMRDGIEDEYTFIRTNKEFHDITARASGNSVFSYLLESLSGILAGASFGVDYPVHRRQAVLKAHEGIYAAIAKRDPDAAHARMEEHIAAYEAYVTKKYPKALDAVPDWGRVIGLRD